MILIRMACTWRNAPPHTTRIVSFISLRFKTCQNLFNHMLTPSHRTRAPEVSSTQRPPGCPTPASRSPSSRAPYGRACPYPCTAQAPPRRTYAPGNVWIVRSLVKDCGCDDIPPLLLPHFTQHTRTYRPYPSIALYSPRSRIGCSAAAHQRETLRGKEGGKKHSRG